MMTRLNDESFLKALSDITVIAHREKSFFDSRVCSYISIFLGKFKLIPKRRKELQNSVIVLKLIRLSFKRVS